MSFIKDYFTLTKQYIDEYGRIYCEIHAPLEEGKDYFLTRKDFHNIAVAFGNFNLQHF